MRVTEQQRQNLSLRSTKIYRLILLVSIALKRLNLMFDRIESIALRSEKSRAKLPLLLLYATETEFMFA